MIDDGWQLRGSLWGLVVAAHLGLGLVLLSYHPSALRTGAVEILDGLQIRFVEVETSHVRAVVDIPPPETAKLPRSRTLTKRASPRPQEPNVPRRDEEASDAAHIQPGSERSPYASTPKPSSIPDYVPGGGFSPGTGLAGNPRVQLPGAPTRKGAPSLHMVDPRSQGVAGMVRILGSLTGAVDRHCVDLDAWQGMTTEERIRNHVSASGMARVRDEYGCESPAARTGNRGQAFPRP